jgi:hypothetical protein
MLREPGTHKSHPDMQSNGWPFKSRVLWTVQWALNSSSRSIKGTNSIQKAVIDPKQGNLNVVDEKVFENVKMTLLPERQYKYRHLKLLCTEHPTAGFQSQ